MKRYETVYPLFEDFISRIILETYRSLEFEKHSPKSIVLFHKIIDSLDQLKGLLIKKPTLNLINLGASINEVYEMDRSVHGMIIYVKFRENPDLTRFSKVEFNTVRPCHI